MDRRWAYGSEFDAATMGCSRSRDAIGQDRRARANGSSRTSCSNRPDIARVGMGDVTTLPGAFIELTTKMMTDPAALARTQIDLFNDSLRVWQTTAERLMGHGAGNEEPSKDKRFKNSAWTESVVFNFVKESYLIWTKAVLAAVHGVEGLDPRPRARSTSIRASSSTRSPRPISSQPIPKFSLRRSRLADRTFCAASRTCSRICSAARVGCQSP